MRFMLQPLNKGFQDKNANVRKTAALACISLFELDPVFVLGKFKNTIHHPVPNMKLFTIGTAEGLIVNNWI